MMLLPSISYSAEHGIQVTVGGMPITESDIKARSKLIIASSGMPNNKSSYNLVKERVMDILIDEQLIKKEAQRLEIEVDDEEIDQAFLALADRNNIPRDKLASFLKSKEIDVTELKNQIKHQLMWSKILASQIQPNITVVDKEIAESRAGIERAARSAAETAELKLAEIVLLYHKESDVQKNKVFAEKLLGQIKKGVSFGSLAKEFSQAQTAQSYGEIGWVASNQIQPDISRKLMRLQVGDIELMPLPDGVRIFKLLDKKVISSEDQELDEDEIRRMIIDKKIDVAVKSYFRKLRKNVHIQIYK
jgi:peptidyl-prolyl cis-trans isomerase SurA